MDAGFADNDPRFRLSMRKLRLRLLANAILDVRMQTMGMTDEQAMELMTKQAFQTQAEAEGKLQRAKLSSTQLPTYYVGLRAWQELRRKYEAKKGKDFDMLAYHDLVLGQGALPFDALETIVMGQPLRSRAAALAAILAAAPCAAQSGQAGPPLPEARGGGGAGGPRPGRRPGRGHRGPDVAAQRYCTTRTRSSRSASSIKVAVLAELFHQAEQAAAGASGQGHARRPLHDGRRGRPGREPVPGRADAGSLARDQPRPGQLHGHGQRQRRHQRPHRAGGHGQRQRPARRPGAEGDAPAPRDAGPGRGAPGAREHLHAARDGRLARGALSRQGPRPGHDRRPHQGAEPAQGQVHPARAARRRGRGQQAGLARGRAHRLRHRLREGPAVRHQRDDELRGGRGGGGGGDRPHRRRRLPPFRPPGPRLALRPASSRRAETSCTEP